MKYEKTSHKFAIIVNKSHDIGVLMNACAHITIGISSMIGDNVHALDYNMPSLNLKSIITTHPVIILQARSSIQLLNFIDKINVTGDITTNMFASCMIGSSAKDQIEKTYKINRHDADVIAVGLFGPYDKITSATKKFSIFSMKSPETTGGDM